MKYELQRMSDIMHGRKYAQSTIKSYLAEIHNFCQYHGLQNPANSTDQMIESYQYYLVQRGYSDSKINIFINALFFYFKNITGEYKRIKQVYRPRKEHSLPKVLSKAEIRRLVEHADNLKHKTIIVLMYSAGLRINELIHLKPADISSDRMTITIRSSKGRKDRISILSQYALQLLRQYWKAYKPVEYLFNGQSSNLYSSKSIQSFVKRYARKAEIPIAVHPHMLRHSFATHLLEDGYSVEHVRKLLGHKRITTTQVYTHVSTLTVMSPADSLFQDSFAA